LRRLDETLTILALGLSDRLRQSLATTTRSKAWSAVRVMWNGGVEVRWYCDGPLPPSSKPWKGFADWSHRDMPELVAALRARDQQLGIVVSVESVA
jgi:hypothetical protein